MYYPCPTDELIYLDTIYYNEQREKAVPTVQLLCMAYPALPCLAFILPFIYHSYIYIKMDCITDKNDRASRANPVRYRGLP